MLKQRVLTAIVLLALLLLVLLAPGVLPLAIFLLVVAVLALFEWWRMTLVPVSLHAEPEATPGEQPAFARVAALLLRQRQGWQRWLPFVTLLLAVWLLLRLWLDYAYLGAALLQVLHDGRELFPAGSAEREQALGMIFGRVWLWAVVGWLIAVVYLAVARVDDVPFSLLLTAFGLLAVPAAGGALLAAYDRGVGYLLSMLAVVWVADIAAYFVGRAVGGPRLAPGISPGKTWSGAAGGVVGVLVLLVGLAWWGQYGGQRNLAADLVLVWGWAGMLAWGLLLAGLSIAGDLFESLLKRRAGRKDSSGLLPGHGGVLDRIDAVLPVAPAAMLLVL